MAKSDNTMLIVIIGIVAVAALFFLQKRNQQQQQLKTVIPSSTTSPALASSSFSPTTVGTPLLATAGGINYTPETISYNPLQGVVEDPFTSAKAEIPIISGSIKTTDPFKFSPEAAGSCQCNDQTCCFYSPFFAEHGLVGSYAGARVCKSVLFGDQVTACNDAFSEQQRKATAGYARAFVAFDQQRHLSYRPVKAFKAARLAEARASRKLGIF